MAEVVWTDEALEHLEAISTYIAVFDAAAARRIAERLTELGDSLATFPNRGRDAGEGRREMTVVWPYVLRYRFEGETMYIVRIRHGARQE